MAERGSWPSIKNNGLLTSNEVFERSCSDPTALVSLQRCHRPEKISRDVAEIGQIILRDQLPMPPKQIIRALPDGMAPEDWYSVINERVFFWTEEERLHRLLNARQYRSLEHDVLTLDTASLLQNHIENVRLCHMNSGNAFPKAHQRDLSTFKRIEDYEVTSTGRPKKPVVELTVLGGVKDIANYVIEVRVMKGAEVMGNIPL